MTSSTAQTDAARPKLRWGWISSCTILGLLVLLIASYGAAAKWSEVVTGTLINVGSALLFSFILYFFENRFTKRIAITVKEVTDAAEVRITEQAEQFTNRLADLEARLEAQLRAEQAAAAETVSGLSDDLTEETVRKALEDAAEDGKLASGSVVVPGYDGALGIQVRFTVAPVEVHSAIGARTVTGLRVEIETKTPPQRIASTFVDEEWTKDDDVAAIAGKLKQKLHRANRHTEARQIDWTYVFKQLQRALELANTVTTKQPAITGSLYEVVSSEWVITSNGAERLSDRNVVTYADMFPDDSSRRPRAFGDEIVPPPPAGVDDELWTYLRSRVKNHRPNIFS